MIFGARFLSALISKERELMEYKEKGGFNPVKDALEILPENIRESISRRINEVINYEPVIGIMGKTGAGKSSLCNAIFKGISVLSVMWKHVHEKRRKYASSLVNAQSD